MNYIDTGSSKPALLMIHGLTSCKESWRNQMELSEHYRLIIPDLLGHSKNVTNKNITLENMTLEVVELLDHLEVKEAFILGHSLGGVIAQDFYKKFPARVRGLILSNTAAVIPHSLGMKVVEEGIKNLEVMSDEEYIRALTKLCLYDKDNEQIIDEMSKYFRINRDTYAECAKAVVGVNYLPTLMFNQKPTLIIGSLNDKVTPYVNALTMKMYCPMAQLKLFNSGHIPNVESSQKFNKEILSFLSYNT